MQVKQNQVERARPVHVHDRAGIGSRKYVGIAFLSEQVLQHEDVGLHIVHYKDAGVG
jgi:hypothetical protein